MTTDETLNRNREGGPASKADRIRVLPESVINQIAAGEVVERPASVVKELIENSVDARSFRIDVELEDGGRRLIRVQDDGVGILPADLPKSFHSHATSKLACSDDLLAIHTMGFRGEALSSIGSVSHARIVSRTHNAAEGAEVAMTAGKLGLPKACGAPEGTLVEVRNLFANVPVRRKFLRSVQTELGHCMEAVTRIALAHPGIAFRVTHNRRETLRLPAVESTAARIEALFGSELVGVLSPVEVQSAALRCFGFAAPPTHDRANSQMQYVFLNGRYIRDKLVFRAIADAYRGMLMARRFPICFLFLEMAPRWVDVNVHPTKIEVRFRSPGAVYSPVREALARALRERQGPGTGDREPESEPRPPTSGRRERIRRAIADFFESHPTPEDHPAAESPSISAPDAAEAAVGVISPPPLSPSAKTDASPPASALAPPAQAPGPAASAPSTRLRTGLRRRFCQTHNAYIVEEVEGGINIIDQHALHERILFQELQEQAREAKVMRQRLLIPATVELSPRDFQTVLARQEELARFGIEVAEFGANTIAVHSVPQMLRECSPAQFLTDLIDDLANEGRTAGPTSQTERILAAVACKAAVKAGQELNTEQVKALLDRRDGINIPPTCPHGRPITLFFSLEDLEKQFRRR